MQTCNITPEMQTRLLRLPPAPPSAIPCTAKGLPTLSYPSASTSPSMHTYTDSRTKKNGHLRLCLPCVAEGLLEAPQDVARRRRGGHSGSGRDLCGVT